MNLNKFIEKIRKVESEVNIENITLNDVNIWPIYRLKIYQKYIKKKITTSFLLSKFFNYFLEFITSLFLYIKNPLREKDVDVIYFTRSSESQDIVSKKLFNRYSDTYQYLYSKNKKIQVIESFDFKSHLKGERTNNKIVYIHFLLVIEKFKFYLLSILKKRDLELVSLKKSINKHFKFQLDIKNDIFWILHLSKFYEKIIKKFNCKQVLFVCFYRPEAMAICLACKRLNIESIEYQHGIQNDNHPMYSNWTKLPKEGFWLLPSNFWMWEKIFAKRIIKWSKGSKYHNVFVGGNLWIDYQKSFLARSKNTILVQKTINRYRILVSLQGDNYLPKFLLDFIKKYANEFDWIFRDHPRIPISTKNRNILEKYSLLNINLSSNCSLYELFKFVNIHITGFSSVGYEASKFNIKTIFFHENAKDGLSDLLNTKNFYFVENENSLLEILNQNNVIRK